MDEREKDIKIKIRGTLELGTSSFIKFSKQNINSTGLYMTFDLLEEITGVPCDAEKQVKLILSYKDEEEKMDFLRDYLIEILEKKFGRYYTSLPTEK